MRGRDYSFPRPRRRRRRVSSLPKMWQISTAPPGVTCLPAAAMRTGHISVAFLTPRDSARPMRQSWTASWVQLSRASRAGTAASSMFRETSASVLDFLLVKRETSYSGKASKKSTFSGMSVSFSHRAWSRAATAAGSTAGFFTACRI